MYFILCAASLCTQAQERPDVINRKDYNRNFYLKTSVGSGNTAWRLDFPENVVDTSNTIQLPPQNKLRFTGSGGEVYLGFSALFGMPWGKFGGGFESSRLMIDSLREEIDGREIKASYHKDRISFNRFYIEYESNPIPLDDNDEFYFIADALAGTYILYPVELDIVPKSNVFVMLGPQVEYRIERWISIIAGGVYEFRYFNYKELFGTTEWVYHNYLHAFNVRIGVKFRVYNAESKRQSPPAERVK